MRTIQRKLTPAAVLPAALLWIGCYTASPTGYAPGVGASYSYGGYSAPSGSISFAIFDHAPRPHRYDGSIWYYGGHPHHHAHGRFCHLSGAHRHDYAPYRSHHYAFHDGYYFWVGDPLAFGLRGTFYAYQGHHRHPHYFGGYCRISGRHHHAYVPSRSAPYYLHNGVYYYTGSYDRRYYAERDRYDARGVRLDRIAEGYRDHESPAHAEPMQDSEQQPRSERVRRAERVDEAGQARRAARDREDEQSLRTEDLGAEDSAQTARDGRRIPRAKRADAAGAATEPASELVSERVPANAGEASADSIRERRAKKSEPASDRAAPQRDAREQAARASEREVARERRAARKRADAAQPPADPAAAGGAGE